MVNLDEHKHKYIFRLLYFVCVDKSLIKDNPKEIHGYQEKKHTWHRLKTPHHSIEPIILVPQELTWILEPHASLLYIKDRVLPPTKQGHMPDPNKKYMFRLLYTICKDNRIGSPNVHIAVFYQERKEAEPHVDRRTKHMLHEDDSRPLPIQTVQAFWAVPEALWWMLAPFAHTFYIMDRNTAFSIPRSSYKMML